MIIRAELIGSEICTAEGITAKGHAPVLALCRKLIEAGYDPAALLECYRGETLCLTVRSIGEGAKLFVKEDGAPRFVTRKQRLNSEQYGEQTLPEACHSEKSSRGVG